MEVTTKLSWICGFEPLRSASQRLMFTVSGLASLLSFSVHPCTANFPLTFVTNAKLESASQNQAAAVVYSWM